MADGCLELRQCFFADLHALVPRVMELGVTGTSAIPEPRTAATTTTTFTRFRDDTAFEACRSGGRRGCWRLYM